MRVKETIRITNFYIPPASSNPGEERNLTTENWPNKQYDIIVGDINVHSTLWDKTARPDKRGDDVEEWLAVNEMHTLNSGDPTQFSKGNDVQSSPDVAIVHSAKLDKFTWKILDDLDSNHKPILTTYEDNINIPKVNNTVKYKWKISKANWEEYTKEIEEKIPDNYQRKSINKMDKLLRKVITNATNPKHG